MPRNTVAFRQLYEAAAQGGSFTARQAFDATLDGVNPSTCWPRRASAVVRRAPESGRKQSELGLAHGSVLESEMGEDVAWRSEGEALTASNARTG